MHDPLEPRWHHTYAGGDGRKRTVSRKALYVSVRIGALVPARGCIAMRWKIRGGTTTQSRRSNRRIPGVSRKGDVRMPRASRSGLLTGRAMSSSEKWVTEQRKTY